MKKDVATLIVGFFLIIAGLSILFDNLGIFNFTSYIFRMWSLILVYFGVKKLIQGHVMSGSLLLIFGVVILLNNFNVISFNLLFTAWPILIIIGGLSVVLKAFSKTPEQLEKDDTNENNETNPNKQINELTIMGDNKKTFTSSDFTGGSVVTIMGSTKLDLTKCKVFKNGGVLEIVVVMGDTHILIPDKFNVRIEAVPILGSVDDNRSGVEEIKDQGTLVIKAVAVMGAVHIKNS